MEYETAQKLKKAILSVIGKHLDLKAYKVFIFGSRVEGKGSERSDIDVGIEGEDPVPDLEMALIHEAVENLPYLYTIEVVDFKKVSPDFYKVAKSHIERLN